MLFKKTGRPDATLFTPEAVALIHKASGGIPRSINLLCNSALVYGFADELPIIDVGVVQGVLEDKGGIGLSGETAAAKPEPTLLPLPAAGGNGDLVAAKTLDRLQIVENSVRKLQMQMEWQIEALERNAAGLKDDLVSTLNKLLHQERERNEKLLYAYSRLKEKFEKLQELQERANEIASRSTEEQGAKQTLSTIPAPPLAKTGSPGWLNIRAWFSS